VEFDAEEAAIGAILKAVLTIRPSRRRSRTRSAERGPGPATEPSAPLTCSALLSHSGSVEQLPATRVHRHLHRWRLSRDGDKWESRFPAIPVNSLARSVNLRESDLPLRLVCLVRNSAWCTRSALSDGISQRPFGRVRYTRAEGV